MLQTQNYLFYNTFIENYHKSIKHTFSPLPSQNKVAEIAKRVFIAIVSPLAYPILGAGAILNCPFRNHQKKSSLSPQIAPKIKIPQPQANTKPQSTSPKMTVIKKPSAKDKHTDIFFVRFLGIQNSNPGFLDIQAAVKGDIEDHEKGYQKGACLYTPNCVQPLAAFDKRHEIGTQIGVDYPFAFLIKPEVKLHYWSLQDMDRNWSRNAHEEAQKKNVKKYKPVDGTFHNLFADWKTIHFTKVDCFIEKIEKVAAAAKAGQKTYRTSGGKNKEIASLLKNHNEGSISYHPEKDVVGILIDKNNTHQANWFRNNYADSKGAKVFKDVFLAYTDDSGKIVKMS